jgi:hypothetical protein
VDKPVKEAGNNAVHLLESAALSPLSAAAFVASPAASVPGEFHRVRNGEIRHIRKRNGSSAPLPDNRRWPARRREESPTRNSSRHSAKHRLVLFAPAMLPHAQRNPLFDIAWIVLGVRLPSVLASTPCSLVCVHRESPGEVLNEARLSLILNFRASRAHGRYSLTATRPSQGPRY